MKEYAYEASLIGLGFGTATILTINMLLGIIIIAASIGTLLITGAIEVKKMTENKGEKDTTSQ